MPFVVRGKRGGCLAAMFRPNRQPGSVFLVDGKCKEYVKFNGCSDDERSSADMVCLGLRAESFLSL